MIVLITTYKIVFLVTTNLIGISENYQYNHMFVKPHFVTNRLHMEDGDLIGPSKFESRRCTLILVLLFPRKSFFWPVGVSWFFVMLSTFFEKMFFAQNDPEVWEWSVSIPDLLGPIFDPFLHKKENGNRPTHNYYKNQNKNHLISIKGRLFSLKGYLTIWTRPSDI